MWPFNKKQESFKIGDFVKCIDDREWNNTPQSLNIVFGKTYKILQITRCCNKCKRDCYDIGCRFSDINHFTTCSKSNSDVPGQGIHWAGSFRFTKSVEEGMTNEEIQEKIKEHVAKEEFELADKLQKLIKHG